VAVFNTYNSFALRDNRGLNILFELKRFYFVPGIGVAFGDATNVNESQI
jgi:hypothetical protein